jgi:WD40-like Beta Propeller Repeat
MVGGQHRADEVTWAEQVGWTCLKKSTATEKHPPRRRADLRISRGMNGQRKAKPKNLLTRSTSLEMVPELGAPLSAQVFSIVCAGTRGNSARFGQGWATTWATRSPASGGPLQKVTNSPESGLFIDEPTISPDGRWLAYCRSNGGSSLWLLKIGSSQAQGP